MKRTPLTRKTPLKAVHRCKHKPCKVVVNRAGVYCSDECKAKARKAVKRGKINKKKAWTVFSEYIRRKFADQDGMVQCVTCGDRKHWKEMQAGHYVDGRGNEVLFDEELVHPQCYTCNVIKHGNKIAYTRYMMDFYGLTFEQCEELQRKFWVSRKWKVGELEGIYEYCKEKLKDI